MYQDQRLTGRGLTNAFDEGVETPDCSEGHELPITFDGTETDLIDQTERSHEFERGTGIRRRFQPKQPQTGEIEL